MQKKGQQGCQTTHLGQGWIKAARLQEGKMGVEGAWACSWLLDRGAGAGASVGGAKLWGWKVAGASRADLSKGDGKSSQMAQWLGQSVTSSQAEAACTHPSHLLQQG